MQLRVSIHLVFFMFYLRGTDCSVLESHFLLIFPAQTVLLQFMGFLQIFKNSWQKYCPEPYLLFAESLQQNWAVFQEKEPSAIYAEQIKEGLRFHSSLMLNIKIKLWITFLIINIFYRLLETLLLFHYKLPTQHLTKLGSISQRFFSFDGGLL